MKTATSPDKAAATRRRTPRAAADTPTKPTKTPKAATKRPRATKAAPAREVQAVATADLDEPNEGELALEDLDENALDPDDLEEVADLEDAADAPPAIEVEDASDDGGAGEETGAGAADADEEDGEPDLGALLTGMLAEEVDAEEDDDADVSSLEVEYVPTARGNEFVCSACFLIWNRRHLADADRKVCRDCIDDVGPAAPRVAAA